MGNNQQVTGSSKKAAVIVTAEVPWSLTDVLSATERAVWVVKSLLLG